MDIIQRILNSAGFLLSGAFELLLVIVLIRMLYNRFRRVQIVEAKVVSKMVTTYDGITLFMYFSKRTNYSVMFHYHGRTVSFYTGGGFYNNLNDGDLGYLTFRGNHLLDFRRYESGGNGEKQNNRQEISELDWEERYGI